MNVMIARACGAAALVLAALAASASAQVATGHMTPSREYDQERLGPQGLQKCQAFKRVRRDSDEMQAADHGQLSPSSTRRLMSELKQARRMAPGHLTPADCGVPL